jgi:DNA-binding IclR family transcriptional regulator
MSFAPLPTVPEEFRILSMMHNIGAVTPDRSLTIDELAQWTDMDASTVRAHLQKLRELGYVQFIEAGGVEKYHVTQVGIIKVLTLYS